MNPAAALSVSDRFMMALEGLYGAVAGRIRGGVMTAAMIVMVCQRVRRVEQRVERLLARFRGGWRPVVGVRRGRGAGGRDAGMASVRVSLAAARLPRGFGWLLPLVPCQAANYASQLRLVLAEPEMVALLAAVPQAGRVLRPLCRMLAIAPEVLRPGGAAADSPCMAGSGAVVPDEDGVERSGGFPAGASSVGRECAVLRGGVSAQGPPLIVAL
jgi:hypothetical protein